MEVISRKEAREKGLVHYYPGRPCKHGHTDLYYAAGGNCVTCQAKKGKAWKRDNRTRYRELIRSAGWREGGLPTPTRPRPEACENCGKLQTEKVLSLDHCHTTGVFRGWLCNRCNLSIGLLGDSLEALRRAVAYLERSQP